MKDLGSIEFVRSQGVQLSPGEILDLGRDAGVLLTPEGPPHFLRTVDYWELQGAFDMFRKTHPDLYWPLDFDPNPYIPVDAQRSKRR